MVEVYPVAEEDLGEPLAVLGEFLRHGEPLREDFVEDFRGAVQAGDLEVLAAREGEEIVGVVVLAFRLSVSIGGRFASIEDLYVRPEARRRGVGRALLEASGERCMERGASYVEVEVVDDAAENFYRELGFESEAGVRVMSRSYPLRGRNF